MAQGMRFAWSGFRLNKDLAPVCLHPTLADLFLRSANPDSVILEPFKALIPIVADKAVSPKCPRNK